MQIYLTAPAVSITNACLAFHHTILFQNLDLALPAGKWTCLLGPSGVGKSTLLRLIAQLTSLDIQASATIQVANDIPLADQIAYMAQTDLLLPWLTVKENVLLNLRLRTQTTHAKKQLTEQADYLLEQTGLSKKAQAYPRQLSGGLRQRVALVRTLMENKPIVLMDEPFSALDAITRYHLQDLAATLLQHRTVLFITHDPLEALRLADDIIVMAGQPASLTLPLKVSLTRPRELSSPELIRLQAHLYRELQQAHAVTT